MVGVRPKSAFGDGEVIYTGGRNNGNHAGRDQVPDLALLQPAHNAGRSVETVCTSSGERYGMDSLHEAGRA
jgi:hypothetical protein